MKYVCIKEFVYDKWDFRKEFLIGDEISEPEITKDKGYRDILVMFKYPAPASLFYYKRIVYIYMPGRKFYKHFRSLAELRQDKINEILN